MDLKTHAAAGRGALAQLVTPHGPLRLPLGRRRPERRLVVCSGSMDGADSAYGMFTLACEHRHLLVDQLRLSLQVQSTSRSVNPEGQRSS